MLTFWRNPFMLTNRPLNNGYMFSTPADQKLTICVGPLCVIQTHKLLFGIRQAFVVLRKPLEQMDFRACWRAHKREGLCSALARDTEGAPFFFTKKHPGYSRHVVMRLSSTSALWLASICCSVAPGFDFRLSNSHTRKVKKLMRCVSATTPWQSQVVLI